MDDFKEVKTVKAREPSFGQYTTMLTLPKAIIRILGLRPGMRFKAGFDGKGRVIYIPIRDSPEEGG